MADQRNCRNCGAPNLPDAQFCANCGVPFVSPTASPSGIAPSASPPPLSQQPPYSPSPQPQRIFGSSRTKVIVGIVVILLLLVGGLVVMSSPILSPTPTPNPTSSPTPEPTLKGPTDLSSYFDGAFESGNSIVERPFTKSINSRANEVYKGITRNASLPESFKTTVVIELTASQSEAKQLYDQMVAQKIKEGYTARTDWISSVKATEPILTNAWGGQLHGSGQFIIKYYYNGDISSWLFETQVQ